ncbi:unnamed protein product [Gongylonema pulchrum]|uniref:DAGKc domain-containing protein n=1 Tax=Gongylonema pulchrum TaxID=637853 RepID=A0A183DPU0_9BILA|nr:unnamed protein product [Gongylonema pulchrum]
MPVGDMQYPHPSVGSRVPGPGIDLQPLVLTACPVVTGGRHMVKVTIVFNSKEDTIRVNDRILRKIESPKAPHLSAAVSRLNRRILVILNPFSGKKCAPKLWETYVAPIFRTSHIDYDFIKTDYERHAVEIAKNVKLDKYDGIAVISGDGLILEVISGFLMRADRERALKMPLAHIPGGTSNGLAASICFQCNEPFSARNVFCTEMALMVVRPRYLPLRINHVQTELDGDKPMFMSITWGLIADIGSFY